MSNKPLLGPNFNAKTALQKLKTVPEKEFIEAGQIMALTLFHEMAQRVPAYQNFLKANAIDANLIKTAQDLGRVPTINKDNYLRAYALDQLCWDGNLGRDRWIISSTSGSTGKPFYFPRQLEQDTQYADLAELYLLSQFKIDQRNTLYIDAFAMGTWIGGVFTYSAVRQVAERGYNLTVSTPGINIAEVINQVRELGPHFDQVIIGCYPPITKDIIDEGIGAGLDWSKYRLGIVFSAEGFNERFRDYIVSHAKLPHPLLSTLNHYGTVDMGTMAHETPLAALIRRLAHADADLYEKIFGQPHKLPTLAQFIPELFYFEEDDGRVICSARSGLPLVRYDLKDNGAVQTFAEIAGHFKSSGLDLMAEARAQGIADTVWNLPFVQVYERADFTVGFRGCEVYPETIRKALSDAGLADKLTGKFTLASDYDDDITPTLTLHIELKPQLQASKNLHNQALKLVLEHLLRENTEFKVLYEASPDKTRPVLKFWEYEYPQHFAKKGKQRWVK
jgi:phenylacetate-CoA ligase